MKRIASSLSLLCGMLSARHLAGLRRRSPKEPSLASDASKATAGLLLLLLGILSIGCEAKLDESLTTLSVGDCIGDSAEEFEDVEVETADHISCDTPGALRVTAVFDMSGGGDWPGLDAIDEAALEGCPGDTLTFMFPTKESWEEI